MTLHSSLWQSIHLLSWSFPNKDKGVSVQLLSKQNFFWKLLLKYLYSPLQFQMHGQARFLLYFFYISNFFSKGKAGYWGVAELHRNRSGESVHTVVAQSSPLYSLDHGTSLPCTILEQPENCSTFSQSASTQKKQKMQSNIKMANPIRGKEKWHWFSATRDSP